MWSTNIEEATVDNKFWRKVIYTGKHLQVVLMSVPPGEELGWEVHNDPDTDQFFRVEEGRGKIVMQKGRNGNKKTFPISDGWSTVVPGGVRHNVINLSQSRALKFYTIYAPPHHPKKLIDKSKEDESKRTASRTHQRRRRT
jgi:mannose-6-phosphate isomerase-like protein (cupin superfamily)